MATDSLRGLAHELDLPERTVRRAAREGMIHGTLISERKYRVTLREEDYLRRNWGLLRELRGALRTEPNARLAVLFGSVATGMHTEHSDVDIMVELRDGSAAALADLTARLESRVGREMQLVRLGDARESAELLVDIARNGRVLVDRGPYWPSLLKEVEDKVGKDTSDPLGGIEFEDLGGNG